MSKIGMRPIKVSSAKVSVNENLVQVASSSTHLSHELPEILKANFENGRLFLSLKDGVLFNKANKAVWGLHRALIASKIKGLEHGFESQIRMVGLAYKAVISGNKLIFSLGYSHKIELPLENDIKIEIDKTGQLLTLKSWDKEQLGLFCARIRAFKKPEPYKGTGVFVNNETIIRKAGKKSKA